MALAQRGEPWSIYLWMPTERERVGARIRAARTAKGLSQRELARMLPGAYEARDVSRWETGKHTPALATLRAVARATDVRLSALLDDEDEPEPWAA